MSHVLPALLLGVCTIFGLLLVPLGLPGLWVMVAGIVGYGWLTDFRSVGVATIGVALGLAFLGEIIEWWLGFRFARTYGGPRRSAWGALVGGGVERGRAGGGRGWPAVLLLAAGLRGLILLVLGLLRLALGARLRFLGFLFTQPQALERLADALAALQPVQDRLSGDVRILRAQVVRHHVGGDELAVRELRVRLACRQVLSLEGVRGRAELFRDAAEPIEVLGSISIHVGRVVCVGCMR